MGGRHATATHFERVFGRRWNLHLMRLINPNGIGSFSPGLRGTKLPWVGVVEEHLPRRGCVDAWHPGATTPSG
jgi:hypothetical protein